MDPHRENAHFVSRPQHSPWTKVCDRGSVEELETNEWAQTDDPVRQRQFVQLLNACLRDKLYRKGVKFSREDQCYYFRATQDLYRAGVRLPEP